MTAVKTYIIACLLNKRLGHDGGQYIWDKVVFQVKDFVMVGAKNVWGNLKVGLKVY